MPSLPTSREGDRKLRSTRCFPLQARCPGISRSSGGLNRLAFPGSTDTADTFVYRPSQFPLTRGALKGGST
jgi:hypothetical protein